MNSSNDSSLTDAEVELKSLPISLGFQMVQIFSGIIVMLLALVANIVMCVTIYRTPKLHTLNSVLIINLAICDLGLAGFVLPIWIATVVKSTSSWISPLFCSIKGFLSGTFLWSSVWFLTALSFDKYLCICHPLRYPSYVTGFRVRITIAYIWIQGLLLALPPFWGWGEYRYRPYVLPICGLGWDGWYTMVSFTIGLYIPLIITLVCHARIFHDASQQSRNIFKMQLELCNPWKDSSFSSSSSENQNHCKASSKNCGWRTFAWIRWCKGCLCYKKDKTISKRSHSSPAINLTQRLKALRAVFVIVGAFIICWGLYLTLVIIVVSRGYHSIPQGSEFAATLLAFSHGAVNPLIFMGLSKDFKHALLCLIREMKKICQKKVKPARQVQWPTIGAHSGIQVIELKQQKLNQRNDQFWCVATHHKDTPCELPMQNIPTPTNGNVPGFIYCVIPPSPVQSEQTV